MNRGGVKHYYVADGLGPVTGSTDDAGTVVQTHENGVFGEITQQSGSLDNPFTYTGRKWEADLGLCYYRTRWNDPSMGVFVTQDRLGTDYYGVVSQRVGRCWTGRAPIWLRSRWLSAIPGERTESGHR